MRAWCGPVSELSPSEHSSDESGLLFLLPRGLSPSWISRLISVSGDVFFFASRTFTEPLVSSSCRHHKVRRSPFPESRMKQERCASTKATKSRKSTCFARKSDMIDAWLINWTITEFFRAGCWGGCVRGPRRFYLCTAWGHPHQIIAVDGITFKVFRVVLINKILFDEKKFAWMRVRVEIFLENLGNEHVKRACICVVIPLEWPLKRCKCSNTGKSRLKDENLQIFSIGNLRRSGRYFSDFTAGLQQMSLVIWCKARTWAHKLIPRLQSHINKENIFYVRLLGNL